MRAALALALIACGQAPAPVAPVAVPAGSSPVDAAVTDDEKLAAIQKAMNELAPASQQCWAVAAAVRFDIEGELAAQIEIGPPHHVTFVRDTTRTPQLAACVQQLLEAYPWAPPLHGQTIQLPFKFSAPDGQSVIDRRFVPFVGQGAASKVSVAVLLDDNNSNNPNVSMFELAIANHGDTGLRSTPRAELWWFRDAAVVSAPALPLTHVAAGTMMYVPAGGARQVTTDGGDVHAVVVVTPGGPEGAARAGALPTPELTQWRSAPAKPVIFVAAKALHVKGHEIFVDPTTLPGTPLSAAIATIAAGQTIPEHVHAKETEVLYFTEGGGTLVVGGVAVSIAATSVAQLPPNTKHAFTATSTVHALQIYAPAGPEQRFK